MTTSETAMCNGIAAILLVNHVRTPEGRHLDAEGAFALAEFWYREYVKMEPGENLDQRFGERFQRQIVCEVYSTDSMMWRPSANFAAAIRQVFCYLTTVYPERHRMNGPKCKTTNGPGPVA